MKEHTYQRTSTKTYAVAAQFNRSSVGSEIKFVINLINRIENEIPLKRDDMLPRWNRRATPAPAGRVVTEDREMVWHDGAPPFPQDQEWFIAETTYGDRANNEPAKLADEGNDLRKQLDAAQSELSRWENPELVDGLEDARRQHEESNGSRVAAGVYITALLHALGHARKQPPERIAYPAPRCTRCGRWYSPRNVIQQNIICGGDVVAGNIYRNDEATTNPTNTARGGDGMGVGRG